MEIPCDAVVWAMNYSSQLARAMFGCAKETTENGRQDKWSEVSESLTVFPPEHQRQTRQENYQK